MAEIMEQIKWERDVAIEQLKELGYGLGEKIRTDEDCISRKAVEDITWQDPSYSDALNALTEVREKIRALPSIQPKAKVGHWIDGVCSECGWDAGQDAFSKDANFCMKCGVKMEVYKNVQ